MSKRLSKLECGVLTALLDHVAFYGAIGRWAMLGPYQNGPLVVPSHQKCCYMISALQGHAVDFLISFPRGVKSALRIFMTEGSQTPQAKLDGRKVSAVVADGLGLLCSANLNFR